MKTFLLLFSIVTIGLASLFSFRSLAGMPKHVSVGDHQLRVLVQGKGSPAVVFESFGVAYLEHMNQVQPTIARQTTTVNYDHAGHWGSEPGPKPRHAGQIVEELRTALRNANVPPPYVLVGFSFGGPYIRVFADRYPDDVAGLVFVDPTQEGFMAWLHEEWPIVNRLTDEQIASQTEWGSQWISMNMASNTVLPDVPITLLTGMERDDSAFVRHVRPRWLKAHQDWLSQFPDARHIVTTNSGHGVPRSEPELVIEAIVDVVQQARSHVAK